MGYEPLPPSVQNLGADHGCAYALVPKKFLNGADVVARLRQVCGEGMPEGVGSDVLDASGLADGFLYRALHFCTAS